MSRPSSATAASGTRRSAPRRAKARRFSRLPARVENTGLVEVPMGMTLREMVFEIGGGIPEGRKFKAVQTGGPSGGCLPSECLDMPVDYESLAKAGSIMGSGGMIVMDESSCMVDVAKYFMEFCMTESCGKCIPCRVGTYQMHRILTAIGNMTATEQDMEMLEELATCSSTPACAGWASRRRIRSSARCARLPRSTGRIFRNTSVLPVSAGRRPREKPHETRRLPSRR